MSSRDSRGVAVAITSAVAELEERVKVTMVSRSCYRPRLGRDVMDNSVRRLMRGEASSTTTRWTPSRMQRQSPVEARGRCSPPQPPCFPVVFFGNALAGFLRERGRAPDLKAPSDNFFADRQRPNETGRCFDAVRPITFAALSEQLGTTNSTPARPGQLFTSSPTQPFCVYPHTTPFFLEPFSAAGETTLVCKQYINRATDHT